MNKLEIAKYIIAYIYIREVDMMESFQRKDYIECNYTNEENKLIDNKLRFLENNQVLWGILNGRWRDNEKDSKLVYEIKDGFLVVMEKLNGQLIGSKSFKIN
tara:strand:- start:995 stop:1300 length:306 start_codon:yes stop_codon:yes gene_type:complete